MVVFEFFTLVDVSLVVEDYLLPFQRLCYVFFNLGVRVCQPIPLFSLLVAPQSRDIIPIILPSLLYAISQFLGR
jgi:hypothetical protein